MRAVRFHGRGDVRIDEVEEPVCGSGQIRPAFVGICGSDLHEYLAGPIIVPVTPHPITGEKLPITLGHEFSGTVEEIGSGIAGFKVGDRVVVKPDIFDATCSSCSMGSFNACEKQGFIGLSTLVEPLAVAWHAVSRSPLQTTDTVLVVGAGPIGLAIIQVLKAKGITSIIAVEVSKQRRSFALAQGATEVLNPVGVDAVAQVRALTENLGAAIAFECSGV
ncbi:hypothetical protein N7447_009863 [Penicillium robsamsonii]|uniref:uncharacterized protein n=1 Tax=Penicillium robsamsonii TaxID=1792511 RepID=UPI0025480BF6|nr:uncharacterized protein N7447_009863 [Penicillium robsamsonii]KAJ5812840.1 hypothetical protein N7447_009863 [Penicillium robsamsonii]